MFKGDSDPLTDLWILPLVLFQHQTVGTCSLDPDCSWFYTLRHFNFIIINEGNVVFRTKININQLIGERKCMSHGCKGDKQSE